MVCEKWELQACGPSEKMALLSTLTVNMKKLCGKGPRGEDSSTDEGEARFNSLAPL